MPSTLGDELRLAFALNRLIELNERPDLVALEKFHTCDWRSLSLSQRKQIHAILLNRRARREREALAAKQQLELFVST